MNLLEKLKSYFNKPNLVIQFWETETGEPLPRFPVIVYDKEIPNDFILYDHVGCFYNEFLGDEPDSNEIIIDKSGRIFNLKKHPEGFNYPIFSQKIMELEEVKSILKLSKIKGIEKYLGIESIEKIILLLKENWNEHKR